MSMTALKSIEGTGIAAAMADIGRSAKAAARTLALSPEAQRSGALAAMANAIRDSEAFQDVCAGRLDRYQIEKRYYRKDGQLLWGRFTATSIKDTAGQPHDVR